MILHGIYDHGKIKIIEKDIPQIKTEIEIIFKETEKSWQRKVKRVKINGEPASVTLIKDRYE